MTQIVPIILCGGTGTRLWPMSRSQSPKQFHKVDGPASLTFFQTTVQRHRGLSYGDPVVVTAAAHLPAVRRQLAELQCPAEIIAEPVARNTGPAVLAAALEVAARDPEALMMVLPSDHVINGNMDEVVQRAIGPAMDERIVMLGIKPLYPETGYGYICDGGAYTTHPGLRRVAHFIEKPPYDEALGLMSTGTAFWASGISLFSAATIIEEFKRLDRRTYEAVELAVGNGERREGELHLNADAFRRAENEPTERIVFEKTERVALLPAALDWNDVGSWTSIHGVGKADAQGNVFHGDVISTETNNALVRSEERLVALVGVPDVIVIDTPDALLVTQRGRCQDVKTVVDLLRKEERAEVRRHRRNEYAWGQSMRLHSSAAYDMSMLRINAGNALAIDPLPGRRLIMVQGNLDLFDGLRRRRLTPGEHAALDGVPSNRVTNNTDDEAEILLMTLRSSIMAGAGNTYSEVPRHVS
ncbi:mannose-1-phosphate guanylyltransferase [Tropicibacter naphthalenivorans]|uniref:Alginate biosynthesis protein AlgA n=1 Tax=Tropicibacter naphthalenivorans TaxID=441103 RepID=A0A0N7M0C4_9RHOB|nr:sugar phosphate nucleotidyltransferase [Tropicibacter naphthalenivorans]CUH80073.1 Alginate biosynthesis protein AlgA [Tropicibacter naphthalenivorans]SMC84309.1 mannose-1-phosphate guanylyltransferase / mannose-6-phosphate isomerase [Tropicibacter naphthalenivorans]